MRVTYGVEVDEAEEDYLGIAEAAMTSFSSAFTPGKHLVEALPVLRFLPSWFPGTSGFRREAKELMRTMLQLRDVPWRAAMTAMVCCQKLLRKLFGVLTGVLGGIDRLQNKGVAPPSMVSGLMSSLSQGKGEGAEEGDDSEEAIIKNAAGNAYGGGADTVSMAIPSSTLGIDTLFQPADVVDRSMVLRGHGSLP